MVFSFFLICLLLIPFSKQLQLQHARAFIKDDCWHIDFEHGSTACLCEEIICPEGKFPEPNNSAVNSYTSTMFGDRMKYEQHVFTHLELWEVPKVKLLYNSSKQVIHGFGGTLNDATIQNLYVMPPKMRQRILHALFDPTIGLGLNHLRVPIGGTDFSSTAYTLADGVPIQNFSLSIEDTNYRVPLINNIHKSFNKTDFKMIASVWSPPAWLKTNHALKGGGRIRGEPGIGWFFNKYAEYIMAFLDEYFKFRITFFGVTPVSVEQDPIKLWRQNSLEMSTEHQIEFRELDLERMISKKHPFWTTKIFHTLPNSLLQYFGETWKIYTKDYETRMSIRPFERIKIGSWITAESYVKRIIFAIRHGATSFVDLSLVLNLYGKPNYAGFMGIAPIIIHEVESSFFRLPEFYMLGHFSRFIIPGSIVLDLEHSLEEDLEILAFTRPDGKTVLIIVNFEPETVDIAVESSRGYLYVSTPPKSIRTILW